MTGQSGSGNLRALGLAILLQLAFAWDILFFNRPTTMLEYAGAVLVLAAIYLGSTGDEKE